MDMQHAADVALTDHLAHLQPLGMKAQFMVDNGKLVGGSLRRRQHLLGLADVESRRLFADDVFPGLQAATAISLCRKGGVQMLTISTLGLATNSCQVATGHAMFLGDGARLGRVGRGDCPRRQAAQAEGGNLGRVCPAGTDKADTQSCVARHEVTLPSQLD